MSKNKFLNELFSFDPSTHYSYNLSETQISNNEQEQKINQKVSKYLQENLTYLTVKYNALINSDIVIRKFTLNGKGKQYNAALIYIDGMVDSKIMDDFILKPLILRNRNNLFDNSQNRVVSEAVTNNITIRKVKKFDLSSYLISCLLPQNSVQEITNFDEVTSGVNSRQLCSFY